MAIVSEEQGSLLLTFARELLRAMLFNTPEPETPRIAALGQPGCCFVTLKSEPGGLLRGCIGHLEAFEPLGENLARNVANAAFSDPRFPPLEPDEFDGVKLEISLLSPMKPIAGLDEFVLGRDGIAMRLGGHSAVFLPQVPAEQHWDKPTTLGFLARKAGLSPEAWRDPETKFETFTAQLLEE